MTVRYDKQTFFHTVAGAVEFSSLSGCVGTLGTESGGPVRFGVMLLVSGPLGQAGTHDKHTTEQAVEGINGAGGMFGRPVELTTVDAEGSASIVTDSYASLADAGVIGFADSLVSDVSFAFAPRAADDAVMEMSSASTNPRLPDAGRADGRKFFGRTVLNSSLQTTTMMKIPDAPQYADADRVALLTVDGAFGSNLGTASGDQFDAEVVIEVSYDPSAGVFGGVIDEVSVNSPDAVGFVSAPGQGRGVFDAYGASDHGASRVFSVGLFDGEILSYYEGLCSASPSSVRTDDYFHLTQRLFDIAPFQPYAAGVHDVLFLMMTAVECASGTSGPAIAGALRTVSGGTGHTVSVGEFDRVQTLVDAGRELNYQGASSGVDLTEAFGPSSSYLVGRVRNGSVEWVELLQHQFLKPGGGR